MNACRRIQALPVRRGFTLVELLVVIVIIAAVLIGVITRVQQFAQASTRLSNMRQAGSLLLGIAAERNGPCSYFSGGNGNFAYRPYVFGYQALDLSVHSVWGGQVSREWGHLPRITDIEWDLTGSHSGSVACLAACRTQKAQYTDSATALKAVYSSTQTAT